MLEQLTQDGLSQWLQAAELSALPDGAVDAHITAIADLVAGHVNASGRYPYLPTSTQLVPSELVSTALVLLRDSLLSTYPGANLATQLEGSTRAAATTRANATLQAVRDGLLELAPWQARSTSTNTLSYGSSSEWGSPL
jgi:hypothetical protein